VSARRRKAAPRGTTVRYSLSEAATVRLTVERALTGRRVKRKGRRLCVTPKRSLRHKRRCTRYKRAGTLKRRGRAGSNRVAFSGRIGSKALKPGRYRLSVVATDAAGNRSARRRVAFQVVKR
jgi:hypothetical protein